MNWDTGLGFERWHQAKKLGLTPGGADRPRLVGLAAAAAAVGPLGEVDARQRLRLLRRASRARAGGLADPVFFDVHAVPQGASSARLAAARVQANAARAIDAGLGTKAAAQPPPLYSYDPDIGRLAVTTPTYNTAIVAVNQHAFPYGGLDLARLFDGQQEVAANIGGRPPRLVRPARPRRRRPARAASQVGRARVGPASRRCG